MRGKRAPKRTIAPDLMYNSRAIAKFINRVMIGGIKYLIFLYSISKFIGQTHAFWLSVQKIRPTTQGLNRRDYNQKIHPRQPRC